MLSRVRVRLSVSRPGCCPGTLFSGCRVSVSASRYAVRPVRPVGMLSRVRVDTSGCPSRLSRVRPAVRCRVPQPSGREVGGTPNQGRRPRVPAMCPLHKISDRQALNLSLHKKVDLDALNLRCSASCPCLMPF